MKTIRIFLASSAELKEDRDAFCLFIARQNDSLHKNDIYLEIVQWENFLDAIASTRLQDEYNKALTKCDIALCLFFTKVGKYTEEEFNTAYTTFHATGKPRIWTYFKDAPINTGAITSEINTLIAFRTRLKELGHFYTVYTNTDNLLLQFRSQLDKYLPTNGASTPSPSLLPAAAAPQPSTNPQPSLEKLIGLIEDDLDNSFMTLDKIFLGKKPLYKDLLKEYIARPGNFSRDDFRNRLILFVKLNYRPTPC